MALRAETYLEHPNSMSIGSDYPEALCSVEEPVLSYALGGSGAPQTPAAPPILRIWSPRQVRIMYAAAIACRTSRVP